MARRNTVEVVITAKDKASKHFKGIGKDVDGLKNALTGMAVAGAAKAAFELGKLGAMSLRTKATFAAISGGAQQASRNLEAMQKATRGAVADTQLMAQASRLMQMGLAGNAEELSKVTEMAVRLGTAMGRDATQSMEEFGLLLANQSIRRLDTFGISAGKARARILELTEANEGMSRETAFMTATMELGDEALNRLGDQTRDAASSFEELEAAIENTKLAVAEELAPTVADLVDKVLPAVKSFTDWIEASKQVSSEITRMRSSFEGFMPLIGTITRLMRIKNQISINEADALFAASMASDTVTNAYNAQTVALKGLGTEMANTAAVVSSDDFTKGWDNWDLPQLQALVAGVTDDLIELEDAGNDVAKTFGELDFNEQELWNLALATGASVDSLADLALSLGIASEADIAAALTTKALIDAFGEGEISARDLALAYAQTGRDLHAAELAAANLASALYGIPSNINTVVRTEYLSEGRPPSWSGAAWSEQEFDPPGRQYQGGGTAQGGTVVGEGGPELVNLPPRSRVFSNEASRMITNNNRTANLTINTSAPHEPIIDDFRMMESFMGA